MPSLMMMRVSLVMLVALLSVAACGRADRAVTPSEARALADRRYVAHATVLGAPTSTIPLPFVRDRGSDTVFVYVEPTAKTKITAIVERSGQVADTFERL
jgi:hypothetical protein